MTIRKTIAQIVGAGALVALCAGSAQANLLTNGGFELPDASGGDVSCSVDWTCFNNSWTNNTAGPAFGPVSYTNNFGVVGAGVQSLKQYGVDGGAFQDVAATAGLTYTAEVWAMNWSGDPLNNLGILQLTFRDSTGGNVLGPAFENFVDSVDDMVNIYLPVEDGADVSDWTRVVASGVAPVGTVSARVLLLHVLTDGTPADGTVRWDGASLTAVPVPAAVWLFGSGILGLIGVARRRKQA